MPYRLMAVHAHPDDESSKGAATSARYAAEGQQVLVVTCTGGEAGDILNEALAEPARSRARRDIAGLRREEMAAAQQALGVDQVWLGYHDSGLPEDGEAIRPGTFASVPVEWSTETLVRVVRRFRPHVMITYDENGGYPHPDHIRSHEVAVAAWRDAADPHRFPGAGDPWPVAKLYYERTMNPARFTALYDAARGREPDGALTQQLAAVVERFADRPDLATTHVDVSGYLDRRDAALRAHASQVAPDNPFFFLPNDLIASAWPTDDYQLVEARVDTQLPETDLFAGIPEDRSN